MAKETNKVLVEMKNGDTFTIELYPQFASQNR